MQSSNNSTIKVPFNLPLYLILISHLLMAGVFAWLIPPFEGPDERQHFAYIEWLVEKNGFPPQGTAAWDTDMKQEAGQPPFYYLLASIPARLVGVSNPRVIYRPNPYFPGPLPRTTLDNDNYAIHHPNDTAELRGGWLAFYLARGVTLMMSTLLIAAVYGFAREVIPTNPAIARGAALLTAFTPQVLFIGSMVSNDIPASAFSTLTLWFLARLLRQPKPSAYKMGAWIGITWGLATLTKISTLILGLPIVLALFWLWGSGRYSLKTFLLTSINSGIGFLITSGWWFVRVWWLYGSPLGLETHDLAPWAMSNQSEIASTVARWLDVGRSYWVALGWGTIRPSEWVYDVFLILGVFAVIGIVWRVIQWFRATPSRNYHSLLLWILLLAGVVANVIFLEVWMHRVIAPYGRLLFPVIAIINVWLVAGWHTLHPKLPWVGYFFFI